MGGTFLKFDLRIREVLGLVSLQEDELKVDDPQLSWVRLVIRCVLCVNLLFRKFVGCGGPKLTGGASGQGCPSGNLWSRATCGG